MEKVKVVKEIPGVLNVGDVLVSPVLGADFTLEETKVTKQGSSERYVSLDYVTVSENVPNFFEFEQPEEETDELDLLIEDCDCDCEYCSECDKQTSSNEFYRTRDEVEARYEFFKERFGLSYPGTEESVVYKNLMWFIEWLEGRKELV